MNFHPPTLKRWDKRLNLLRVPRYRIPHHKHDRGANYEQYESAERMCVVVSLVIEVEERSDKVEQYEHLVEVRDGDMPNVRSDQIGLVPPHHHPDETRQRSAPRQLRCDCPRRWRAR